MVWKYEMKNYRNKQFVSVQFQAILSSMMKSQAVRLCPAQDLHHPFVQSPISHLVAILVIRLSRYCDQVNLILLNNGSKVPEEWCWLSGYAKEKL